MIRTFLILCAALTLPTFAADSPLVQAAKRANRLGKVPANVITNETLATSGGGLSVAPTQAPISMAFAPAPNSTAGATAGPRVSSPPPAPAAAPVYEGSSRISNSTPRSTATSSTPPSSATSSTPQSTARTSQPPSAAPVAPQSTASSTAIPPVPPRRVD